MKQLNWFIQEKLRIDKHLNYKEYKYFPKTRNELSNIIKQRIKDEKDNIDFNDIDTSEIKNMEGIFAYIFLNITNIDISNWDVSNVENMEEMFADCPNLESIGDISSWDVSKLKDITGLFYRCPKLDFIGDLDKWNISNIKYMTNAFFGVKNSKIIPKWYM